MPTWAENFIKGILDNSEADNWDDAIQEWDLEAIYHTEEFEYCLCKHDIKENCVMRNRLNDNRIIVGNCCIKKFPAFSGGDDDRSLSFKALATGRVNASLIKMAYNFGHINTWERNFMMDTWRKRKFSIKQKNVFDRIKARIFLKMASNGRGGEET